MAQNDYQMALLLQQFEHEANLENPTSSLIYKKSKNYQNPAKSLTDPSWELIDPTPNIHVLFMAFNEKYFWNKLLAVCVDWSKRMTSCAGVCSYQGRGGMCQITLSEPLLKLRPRKDLVETLLHEMIHAYLFVTHNNRDRDGHGPEFHKHMYRINAEAGTNITVYHDFHDEVRLYKQHWWRCNGPCQNRKPYFGMVRRATNRAPGLYDRWWTEHQHNCGGTFIKVKEPEKKQKQKAQKENKPVISPKNDIRNFYPILNKTTKSNVNSFSNIDGSTTRTANKITGFKDLNGTKPKNALANSSSTIVINKKPTTKTKNNTNQMEKPISGVVQPELPPFNAFTGKGQVLGSKNPSDNNDYAIVRNHWLNKFANSSPSTSKRLFPNSGSGTTKKLKQETTVISSNASVAKVEVIDLDSSIDDCEKVNCPICYKSFSVSEVNAHLDVCLETQETESPKSKPSNCPVCEQCINAADFEKHVEICLNTVFTDSNDPEDFKDFNSKELISCLVCNKQIPKSDLNSHLDECMGDNIFNNSDYINDNFNGGTDVKSSVDSNTASDDSNKKYNCPVCLEQFSICDMSAHLDKCLVTDEICKDRSIVDLFLEDF